MVEIISVTAENIDKSGFFCAANARGTPGWEAKRRWLNDRFAEGLQMRVLGDGERGFIEFMPGARAWRRHLSEHAGHPSAGASVIETAASCVTSNRERFGKESFIETID